MLPVDLMVELLMANRQSYIRSGVEVSWVYVDQEKVKIIEAYHYGQLAIRIREYLQSLVPTPKLLSECEEFEYLSCQYQPGIGVMRDGEFAYEADGTCGGLAKDFQVIQPVEVQ